MGGFTEIAGGILDLGGQLFGAHSARNAERDARDWQTKMTKRAVQMRVADLKAAGLNPMLGYTGSADVPTPRVPEQPDFGGVASRAIGAYSARTARNVAEQQVEQSKANIDLTEAQTDKTNAEAAIVRNQMPYSGENAFNSMRILERQAREMEEKVDSIIKDNAIKDLSTAQMEALQPLLVEYQSLMNRGQKLGLTQKEIESKFFETVPAAKWIQLLRGAVGK